MAQDTVIDSLRININANANKAITGLTNLQNALRSTSTEIDRFGNSTSKLGNWGRGVGGKGRGGTDDALIKTKRLMTRLSGLKGMAKSTMTGISNAFTKAGSVISRVTSSMTRNIGFLNKSMRQTSLLSTSIKTAIGTLLGIRGLAGIFNGVKNSITMGADITEIDHIVESVFSDHMVGYVHQWADEAISSFGIASGEAKKYAGTLSAMFQSSGVNQDAAGKMAMDLVNLAGDLSAFYNEDTETSFEKIKSGLSGMVRPLRAYGIDLSAATLEEFRLAQGIQTSYSAMTQAEKVMLRYEYLMANTKTQQGDFARTADSMANAMRTLRAYAAAVQTQIGVGLASALRHVIVILRDLMRYVLKAATAFATFMQTIFGKYKGGASGVAIDDLKDAAGYADDLGDSAGNAATGLGDASDAAKQLKKDLSVLPFDELNQLNKDHEAASSGSGGSGSGGGGGVGGGVGGLLDWDDLLNNSEVGKLPEAISAWGQQIKAAFQNNDWNLLGQIVATGLNQGIQKVYDLLDPKKVAEKVDPWLEAFTTSFNSFVKWFDFDLLGRTVGRGINNVVHILNTTIEGINWNRLGTQVANGLNGLFREVNWQGLGNLVGNKLMALWNTINGFVHGFSWFGLGKSIANFFNGVFKKVDFSTIADTLATGLNGVFTSLASFTAGFDWTNLVNKLARGINTFIRNFDWKSNGQKLNNFLQHLADALVDFVDEVNWEELGQSIADFLAEIEWVKLLKKVAEAVTEAFAGLLKGLWSEPEGKIATAIITGLALIKFSHSSFALFAGNLVRAVTGKTLTENLTTAFKGLFKKSVTDAAASQTVTASASTATAGLAAQIGTTALQLGGVSVAFGAAYYGLTQWEKGIAKSIETTKGGNGIITEFGSVVDHLSVVLQASGKINEQQADALWRLVDSQESAGTSAKDMSGMVVKALQDMGLESEDIIPILDSMGMMAYGSMDSFWDLKDAAENLGTATKNASDEIESASNKSSTSISDMVSTIRGRLSEANDSAKQYADDVRDKVTGVISSWKSAGTATDDFAKTAKTNMNDTSTSVADFKTKANENLEQNKSKFGDWQSISIGHMVSMITKMATVIQASKTMSESSSGYADNMANAFKTAFSNINGAAQSMVEQFSSTMTSIETSVSNTMANIHNLMSIDLYWDGYNAAQSFANGFQSVHVPVPYMYVRDYQYLDLGNGGMYIPYFGVAWYKRGGLFEGGDGQVVGIAEGGRDEAVLPLEDRRAMARIGTAIAEAGGTGGFNEDMADRIAEKIADVLINVRPAEQQPMNYVELKVDSEVLARAVTKGQQKLDYRNNPTAQVAY